MNVAENDGNTQLCVNITHGNVESSANFFYSTNSGTATGMLYTFTPPPLSNSYAPYSVVVAPSNRSNIASEIYSMHACTTFGKCL